MTSVASSGGGGTLWLVATPIGNLDDLAPRAIHVLSTAALICCEDTRRTGRLLHHIGVRAQRLAVANDHTETARIAEVLSVLGDGQDVAIVSDAGTPGISDPGERLVSAAIAAGFAISSVPGPSAATMALTISGLPTGPYCFEGFLPRAGRDRTSRLEALATERRTTVLYEAPHRIVRTLADLKDSCGDDRPVAVCRELTKLYEEVRRGTLGSIAVGDPRGEYVIVLGGFVDDGQIPDDNTIRSALSNELAGGVSKKDAVATVSAALGIPKRRVYGIAIAD